MPLFKRSHALFRNAALLLTLTYLYGCASRTSADTPTTCAQAGYPLQDPAEQVNRGNFAFNQVIDEDAIEPVARGYGYTPDFYQLGLDNFTTHFNQPTVFLDSLPHVNGKPSFEGIDAPGIALRRSAFGQTFGIWGVISGPLVATDAT